MDDVSSLMTGNDQRVEQLKRSRYNNEHVDGGSVMHVVVQERVPGRGRGLGPPRQVSADRGLADRDAEFEALAVDAGLTPKRVFLAHTADQITNLAVHAWPAGAYNTRAKALIALEAAEATVFDRILAGLARRIPPVVVDDAPVHENVATGHAIDLAAHSSDRVEWATAFRMQPARDNIIVDHLRAGPLDPSADASVTSDRRTGSAIGIDATYPYGTVIRKAADASKVCGPALAEHGLEYVEVADVPGWHDYDFPELRKRGSA